VSPPQDLSGAAALALVQDLERFDPNGADLLSHTNSLRRFFHRAGPWTQVNYLMVIRYPPEAFARNFLWATVMLNNRQRRTSPHASTHYTLLTLRGDTLRQAAAQAYLGADHEVSPIYHALAASGHNDVAFRQAIYAANQAFGAVFNAAFPPDRYRDAKRLRLRARMFLQASGGMSRILSDLHDAGRI
jgi:hypothetical protein